VSAETVEDAAGAGSGVGARLASARAARSLSVADIARQLKFSSRQVEALEADCYDRLPGAVFTRGFIRNYARLVGLDPAPLLTEADSRLPHNVQPTPGLPPSADIPFPGRRPVKWYRYAVAALLLAVSGVVFEIYREDETPEVPLKPSLAATPPPAAVSPAPPIVAAAAATTSAAPADVAPSVHVKIESAVAEPSLTFTFVQESWVEVRDGHGHRLLWQLNPAGTQQKVSGPPPLSLVIGNAGGVRLQVNDKLFDLNPYIDVDVARLVLD